jgi:hypothetical protein
MAFQFKIQIKGITKPPVWRRVLVPETFTFHRFHEIIQAAFGWRNSHLYQFSDGGYQAGYNISEPHEDDWNPVVDSRKKKLSTVFTSPGERFTYIYDFGDDWVHQITLETVTLEKITHASCLAGKGACLPENCGGPWGYENMKELLTNDPKSEEAKDVREWLWLDEDEAWDANAFSVEDADRRVKEV